MSSPRLNEYAIVRLDKSTKGIKGADLAPDDPRRTRYYRRATCLATALVQMSNQFPGEKFYAVQVTENVKPHFTEAA